jgi:hypothetical protein
MTCSKATFFPALYEVPGFGSASNLTPNGPRMLTAGPAPPICDWYDSRIFFRAFISMSTGSKVSISSKLSPSVDAVLTGTWNYVSFIYEMAINDVFNALTLERGARIL